MRFGKGDALAAAPFEMLVVAKQGLDRGRRGAKPWERRSPEWPGTNAQGACPHLRLKSDEPKLQLLTKKHLNFLPYAKLV